MQRPVHADGNPALRCGLAGSFARFAGARMVDEVILPA
jgi:hypothetical protein